MASNLRFAIDRNRLPQSAFALGIHVASFVRHLFQPEVANMVEDAITNCTSGMAFVRVSSGLARNGCRCFPGCETTCSVANAGNLALRDFRNDFRCALALVGSTIHSSNATASSWVGWHVGSDPVPSLRYFPASRSPLAKPRRRCQTHYVVATPRYLARRILGFAPKEICQSFESGDASGGARDLSDPLSLTK